MARSLVYSEAAVRRLLDLPPTVPVQTQSFLRVIWVWAKGQRPTFISKAALRRHFVQYRQGQARQLEVTDLFQERYAVDNPATGSRYQVVVHADGPECDCADYYWQQRRLGHGCCKHGYAVLQHLGYGSLEEFLGHHRSEAWASSPPAA